MQRMQTYVQFILCKPVPVSYEMLDISFCPSASSLFRKFLEGIRLGTQNFLIKK